MRAVKLFCKKPLGFLPLNGKINPKMYMYNSLNPYRPHNKDVPQNNIKRKK